MSVSNLQQILPAILQQQFGSQLLCAVVHGACLEPDFDAKKHGPIDVSLFLETVNPRDLPDFTPLLKALAKNRASLAFLFTPETVATAADAFPLEFLHLSNRHLFVSTETLFPLQDFQPAPAALRLQCERELRGLLIHLYREYALRNHNARDLRNLFAQTLPRFQPVFRGIYWLLQGGRYPESNAQSLEFIDSSWQLGNIFTRLDKASKDLQELRWLTHDYILSIEKILKTIDRLEVPL